MNKWTYVGVATLTDGTKVEGPMRVGTKHARHALISKLRGEGKSYTKLTTKRYGRIDVEGTKMLNKVLGSLF